MRSLVRLLLAVALVFGGDVVVASTDAHAATVAGAGALFPVGDPAYPKNEPRYGDKVVVQGSSDGRFTVNVNGARPFMLSFEPAYGKRFGVGHYYVGGPTGHYRMDVRIGSSGFQLYGEIQILDWALGANGVPTRFDIVFYSSHGAGPFGQVRYGQDPHESVAIATTRPTWGPTPVGSVPIIATQYLHNLSVAPVVVGAASLSGTGRADYVLGANGCSGRTLAAGASCTFTIGFSPKQAGPRVATVSIPVGGKRKDIHLSGSAALGSSKITIGGNSRITSGATRTYVDAGSTVLYAHRQPTAYMFTHNVVYGPTHDTLLFMIAAPDGSKPTVGKHVVNASGPSTLYLNIGSNGASFGSSTGTATVRRFDVDAYDRPVAADVDYVLWDGFDPAHQLTGALRWRARADYTPPAAPTGLSITTVSTTRTAAWVAGGGGGVASVARVVAGDGAGATPVDGYPVSSGTATTATLPTLRKGQTYTLLVFAIDAAGNPSKPGKKSFVA